MSATASNTESATCAYCNGPRNPHDSVEGSYCSAACYYRERGERVLAQIESDHTVCATCYGRVKTIEPIPPEKCEAADGYQHQTEYTEISIDEFPGEADGSAAGRSASPARALESTRWGCACGTVDPYDTHAEIQNVLLAEVIDNCFHALKYLYEKDEGCVPYPPDRREYNDALREHWRDAAYAIGRAVFADARES